MPNQTPIKAPLSYLLIARYIIIHLLLLILVYIVYGFLTKQILFPSESAFLNMDAQNYLKIKNSGYSYSEAYGSLVAFFPGFPYLWKYSGLGLYGICFLNASIFLVSFLFLCREFAHNKFEILFFLSLPSILFMYVPFSESLFFATSTILLIGLSKRNTGLVMAGLFLCSITRSAANIFLPAIIIMEIIASENPSRIKNIFLYLLSAVSGVMLVVWIQFAQTGHWFVFLSTQKYWGVALRFPVLPFHTWGKMDYLDGASLVAGLIAIWMVLKYLYQFLAKKERFANKAVIFSLLYISGLTFFTIAFKGGAIFSFNRYIIPTAFFMVGLCYFIREKSFTYKQTAIAALVIFILWLPFFYSFVHILVITGFLILTLYIGLYMLLNHKNHSTRRTAFLVLYGINLIAQVFLIYKFTTLHWVG